MEIIILDEILSDGLGAPVTFHYFVLCLLNVALILRVCLINYSLYCHFISLHGANNAIVGAEFICQNYLSTCTLKLCCFCLFAEVPYLVHGIAALQINISETFFYSLIKACGFLSDAARTNGEI